MAVSFFEGVQLHHVFNFLLIILFPLLRLVDPFRSFLFPHVAPGLETREAEILVFLGCIVAIKSRRQNTSEGFLSTLFTFSQLTSAVLFFRLHKLVGAIYCVLCLVCFLLFPLKEFQGDSNVIRLTPGRLDNVLQEDKVGSADRYLVLELMATWSPPCIQFAREFSDLSLKYAREHIRFAKIDVGHYKHLADRFKIDVSVASKQLPTVILFKNGEEFSRRPHLSEDGTVIRCRVNENLIANDFRLEELAAVGAEAVQEDDDGTEQAFTTAGGAASSQQQPRRRARGRKASAN